MGKTKRDIRRWQRYRWWMRWFGDRGIGSVEASTKTRDCLREEDHAYGIWHSGMYAGMGIFKRLERRRQRYRTRRELREEIGRAEQ